MQEPMQRDGQRASLVGKGSEMVRLGLKSGTYKKTSKPVQGENKGRGVGRSG